MHIEIDPGSGFCFGVVKAIETAENTLYKNGSIFCLGDIVHNEGEIARLQAKGLKTISTDDFPKLKDKKVLIRAHGEPPATYSKARQYDIELIDATCPVVLKLQQRVRKAWEQLKPLGGKVIIFGKKGHAEVIGLIGQTNNEALVIEDINDLEEIDFSLPIELFSQTTKEPEKYRIIASELKRRMALRDNHRLKVHDTICGQVANRKPDIALFAQKHDVLIFVGGAKSSNGKMLFETCLESNPNSYFVTSEKEVDFERIKDARSIGISGATSTPRWLMERVARAIKEHFK